MSAMKFIPFLLLASSAAAQAPLSFEVASVKLVSSTDPNPLGTAQGRRVDPATQLKIEVDPARAHYGNITLTMLLRTAFRVDTYQLSGPDWMATTKYDVTGKIPAGVSQNQVPEMLQTLLAERLKLVVRRAQKDFDVYVMTVSKEGIKLKAKPADYEGSAFKNMTLMTMPFLASTLTPANGKPIIDRTELPGQFLLSEDQFTQALKLRFAEMRRGNSETNQAAEPTGDTIFSFAQSIGLKIEAKKMSLPFIVVESVEKTPIDN